MTATHHPERDSGTSIDQPSKTLVVVANRLPVRRAAKRGTLWERSPGGLVSALEPAVRAHPSLWIGWTGSSGATPHPFEYDGIALHPVAIGSAEKRNFYDGFANGTLWPLYHDSIRIPEFHHHWWDSFVAVNERFAERAAALSPRGALVWVHDYQLSLVPGMLRRLRGDLRIGFFLHIPFPAQELFLRIPWRVKVIEGMLGADVVGFQTRVGADNFRQIVHRLLGTKRSRTTIDIDGRRVDVGTFPVGIDADRMAAIAAEPATVAAANAIREQLGNPRTVVLGVDRLDYTKGIEVRLRAWRELLEAGVVDPRETAFVQIAQPSRDEAPGYRQVRRMVEQTVGEINGRFSHLGGSAVTYLYQGQTFHEVAALYRAADVMLVTPFRDGMNLVAKEYIASRLDGDGVLVLSEFAGAIHQLGDALAVNPFDIDGMKAAIGRALNMPLAEQRRRMRGLCRSVHRYDAEWWAAEFLAALTSP